MVEIVSPGWSQGGSTLIGASIAAYRPFNRYVAFVDAATSFDPSALNRSSLEHLLWVQATGLKPALQAVDTLLRDPNFPLLLVDLRLVDVVRLRRQVSHTWYRFQRLVEHNRQTAVFLTPYRVIKGSHFWSTVDTVWNLPDLREERSALLRNLRFREQQLDWQAGRENERRVG